MILTIQLKKFFTQINKASDASNIWAAKDDKESCIDGELKKVNCDEKKFVVCAMPGISYYI